MLSNGSLRHFSNVSYNSVATAALYAMHYLLYYSTLYLSQFPCAHLQCRRSAAYLKCESTQPI